MMEKLPMCRICLVANVRILVINKNLHEVYEKLTDIPFVTEDRRPMLACFFCCAKLKQCYRLLRQCLEAEKLFAQMMNEDYELNPLINQDHIQLFSGFIISPTENISIVDDVQTENIAVKEELPAVCERLDDVIQPKEEHQSDELELDNFENSFLDVADIRPHHSESDLEEDVPLMEFKTEVEEEQIVCENKRRARETTRPTATKKRKLDTRRTKLEDAITAEQTKKDKPYKCDICQHNFIHKRTLTKHIRIHTGKKPYKCEVCQRSFNQKCDLTKHNRIHTGEKPYKCNVCKRSFIQNGHLTKHIRIHTGKKPYKCEVCQRSFNQKCDLTKHNRIHTGEKPYKCDICQRSFSQKFDLTKHNRIHTGEKPYKCNVCQRSFIQNGHLTRHSYTHR